MKRATGNRPDRRSRAARATNCSAAFRASSSASWQIMMSRLITGKKRRVVGGAAQGGLRIQNDLNRCRRQKIGVPSLIDESSHECAVFELVEDLRRDAAADVKPAHRLSRAAPDCPPPRRKPTRRDSMPRRKSPLRWPTPPVKSPRLDHRAAANRSVSHAGSSIPRALFEKSVNIEQSGPGKHPFITHVTKPRDQIAQQLDFQFIARREIGVAAFGCQADENGARRRTRSLVPSRCRRRSALYFLLGASSPSLSVKNSSFSSVKIP